MNAIDIDQVLDTLLTTKIFKSEEDFKRYGDGVKAIESNCEGTRMRVEHIIKLMKCLSDHECGGHGLTQGTLNILYSCDKAVFAKALAANYQDIRKSAPIESELLVAVLENNECASAFVKALAKQTPERKDHALQDVRRVANQNGFFISI